MARRYLYLSACILFGVAAVMTLLHRETIAEKIGVAVYAVFFIGVIWELLVHIKTK